MAENERQVLVLDDDEGNRMLLDVALRAGGLSGDCVGTGTEALRKAERTRYEAALLDVNLPDMSGLEVARAIRAFDEQVVIVVTTIDDDDETMRQAKACGCDVFMIKPFNLDQLLGFLRGMDARKLRSSEPMVIIDNTGGDRRYL